MSDVPVSLVALISKRQLCLSCIASVTRMNVDALETAIDIFRRTLSMPRDVDRCDECGAYRIVFRLGRT
jgi:hypothetical protein